jgi:hypothetical protein
MTGVVWPRLAGGLPPLQAPCLMRFSDSAILGTLPMDGPCCRGLARGDQESVGEPTDGFLRGLRVELECVPFQFPHVEKAI